MIKWLGRKGPVAIQKFLSLGAKLFVVLEAIHEIPLIIFYYFNLFSTSSLLILILDSNG